MATYTSFLNLEKPTTSERLDVLKINSNWDKIDEGVSSLNSNIGNKLDSPTDIALNYNDTQEINLVSGAAYLLIVTRTNTSVTTTGGLYLIQSHSTASYIRPIIESTSATVTISGTVLTVGTNSNYTHFTLLRLL